MNKIFLILSTLVFCGLGLTACGAQNDKEAEISGTEKTVGSPFVSDKAAPAPTQEPPETELPDTEQETLFELKNSIQGVIADSVQDDIQEAVEEKMKKTGEVER